MSTTEEQVSQIPPTTIDPPVEPAAVTPPSEPAPPQTRRDILAEQFKKDTERGKHAQFQPREQGKFAGAPQFPTPTRPPLIPSLKKEVQPHWDAAPIELLQEIVRREEDHNKGIVPLKQKAQQADELLREFEPYQEILQREGATPKTAINTLLKAAQIVRTGTPLDKASLIVTTMRQWGIPLEHVQQLLGGQQPQQPNSIPSLAAPDPQLTALVQQVQALTQAQTQRQQEEQQRHEAQAVQAITKFAEDPANAHFDAVQEKMLGLLQSPQVMKDVMGLDTSAMDYSQKLKVAYETAIRLDPALSTQVAQQAAQQASQVQKSKAAAVQVKGAPGTGPAPVIDPSDRRAFIANLVKRAR
jgi:DNA-binding transcriptional MerR regulator